MSCETGIPTSLNPPRVSPLAKWRVSWDAKRGFEFPILWHQAAERSRLSVPQAVPWFGSSSTTMFVRLVGYLTNHLSKNDGQQRIGSSNAQGDAAIGGVVWGRICSGDDEARQGLSV